MQSAMPLGGRLFPSIDLSTLSQLELIRNYDHVLNCLRSLFTQRYSYATFIVTRYKTIYLFCLAEVLFDILCAVKHLYSKSKVTKCMRTAHCVVQSACVSLLAFVECLTLVWSEMRGLFTRFNSVVLYHKSLNLRTG